MTEKLKFGVLIFCKGQRSKSEAWFFKMKDAVKFYKDALVRYKNHEISAINFNPDGEYNDD